MERTGVKPRADKRAAVWAAERIGRLKLNGRVVRYSDLSRLLELEGLSALLAMNLSLWESLGVLLADDERTAGIDFDALASEARRLRDDLADQTIAASKRLLA